MVSFDLCEGNPGALTFMMAAYQKLMFHAEHGFQRMQDNGIRGTMLYMLWNDCCGRNTDLAIQVMEEYPISEILTHINYGNGRGIPIETAEKSQAGAGA